MPYLIFVCLVQSPARKLSEVGQPCIISPILGMAKLRIRKVVAQNYMSRVVFVIHACWLKSTISLIFGYPVKNTPFVEMLLC